MYSHESAIAMYLFAEMSVGGIFSESTAHSQAYVLGTLVPVGQLRGRTGCRGNERGIRRIWKMSCTSTFDLSV